MDENEVKLETMKRRILDEGEGLVSTKIENGKYLVRLIDGEEIKFHESYKAIVDSTLNQVKHGVRGKQKGKYENVNGQRSVK